MLWRECLYREPAVRWFPGAGASGDDNHQYKHKHKHQQQHQQQHRHMHRHQRATSGVRVMHRVGREWPVPAGQVVWRANVTIVVASYKYRLDWLKTIPPIFDVAVYDKFDFGVSNVSNASQRNVNQGPGHTGTDDLARLAYYRVLPNYGRTGPTGKGCTVARPCGGSRGSNPNPTDYNPTPYPYTPNPNPNLCPNPNLNPNPDQAARASPTYTCSSSSTSGITCPTSSSLRRSLHARVPNLYT